MSGSAFGPSGHPTTPGALQGLAQVAAARKQLREARELFQQSLEMYERILGPTHPDVRDVLLDLAALLRTAHRGSEARGSLHASAATFRHPCTAYPSMRWRGDKM